MTRLLWVLLIVLFLLLFRVMDEVGSTNDRISMVSDQQIMYAATLGKYQRAYLCEHRHSPADACKSEKSPESFKEDGQGFRSIPETSP